MTEKLATITDVLDLKDGDTVILKRGANVIREKVRVSGGNRYLALGGPVTYQPVRVRYFLESGYVGQRVVPVEPVPTEPGHYVDKNGKPWLLTGQHARVFSETPWIAWDGGKFDSERAGRVFGPFTKVEPAPSKVDPPIVVDTDGDKWRRLPNGEYRYNHLTKTLDKVREDHGPLHLPGAAI